MFSRQTYENIKQRILDDTNLNLDKREGSFLNNQISPVAEELAKAYINMGDILSLGFIEDTFDTFLDKRVGEFGVYRKQGARSTGAIKVEGRDGTVISNGTLLKSNDLYFTVLNDIELPTDNILYVEANEVGYKYNVVEGTEFELVEQDDSITRLYNEQSFIGGVDIETDDELRRRYIKVVNNPSTSGNKNHYEEWALEVNGVGRALVYPLHAGPGSVKVMVIGNDNKPVDSDIIENARLHIGENMPIGCSLTVSTPTLLNITLNATVKLKEGYTIDEIQEYFKVGLDDYLKTITTELTYSKVYGILVNLPGVGDIDSLTINDNTINISISEDKIVNISSVNISEVI